MTNTNSEKMENYKFTKKKSLEGLTPVCPFLNLFFCLREHLGCRQPVQDVRHLRPRHGLQVRGPNPWNSPAPPLCNGSYGLQQTSGQRWSKSGNDKLQ